MSDRLAARLMEWVRVEDQAPSWSKVRAAWVIVSLHVCIRLTLAIWFDGRARWLIALPVALYAAGMWRRALRPVAVALTLVQVVRFSRSFPDVSNHYLIECLCVLVFAAVDLGRDEDRVLCLGWLRWIVVVVLLMSGVQKLLHGAYFHGQYLSYMVGSTERFRWFFAPMLPAGEVARLQSLSAAVQQIQFEAGRPIAPLPGPFRVDSLWLVAVSNAVWLGEVALAFGLLWRRVRPLALAGSVLLMAGILASSWEFFFDTLFINLILLFARSALNLKLLPLSLVSYGYYALVGFGVLRAAFVW